MPDQHSSAPPSHKLLKQPDCIARLLSAFWHVPTLCKVQHSPLVPPSPAPLPYLAAPLAPGGTQHLSNTCSKDKPRGERSHPAPYLSPGPPLCSHLTHHPQLLPMSGCCLCSHLCAGLCSLSSLALQLFPKRRTEEHYNPVGTQRRGFGRSDL